ncbi:hypothetical protein HY572_03190 [Candidatus Micrarchaeota archaeon]|nr:hypothetical protein [Candidatus Micrarchaeota archaeon]
MLLLHHFLEEHATERLTNQTEKHAEIQLVSEDGEARISVNLAFRLHDRQRAELGERLQRLRRSINVTGLQLTMGRNQGTDGRRNATLYLEYQGKAERVNALKSRFEELGRKLDGQKK